MTVIYGIGWDSFLGMLGCLTLMSINVGCRLAGYSYLKIASSPYLASLTAEDLAPFPDVGLVDLEDTGVPCIDIWGLRQHGYDVSLYNFSFLVLFVTGPMFVACPRVCVLTCAFMSCDLSFR